MLERQVQKGIISPSCSPYVSPAFLVAKANGKSRLVLDFRVLNSHIDKACWPIPKIADILDKLSGCNYITTLDLCEGFHQLGLHKDSRKYTAFITDFGLYEWNVSPMGLKTSPNLFQHTMDRILQGMSMDPGLLDGSKTPCDVIHLQKNLIGEDCFIYIDVFCSRISE